MMRVNVPAGKVVIDGVEEHIATGEPFVARTIDMSECPF